jgi:hypothetical protein
MKAWFALAAILLAPVVHAQCNVILVSDPAAPNAYQPTTIQLQHWLQGSNLHTPVLLSITGNEILVQQPQDDVPPPPGLPLCRLSTPLNLGVLAEGSYHVTWQLRDTLSPTILAQFEFQLLVAAAPALPVLSPALTALFIALVSAGACMTLRSRV